MWVILGAWQEVRRFSASSIRHLGHNMCTTAQAGMGFSVTMIKSSGAVQGHSFLAEFDEDFLRLRWTAIDDVVP